MIRAALYPGYLTDMQRKGSIDDQHNVCDGSQDATAHSFLAEMPDYRNTPHE
jgi:hypothetical protein